jgi:uncharacterized protein DUF4395
MAATTTTGAGTLDQSALKVTQAGIVTTLLLAFLLDALWPPVAIWVPLLGLVMLAGSVEPRLALFRQLYLRVLRPSNLVRPRVIVDSMRPHAFAQQMGGAFLLLASLFLFPLGNAVIGWGLTWVVIVLAFVNFAFNFCLGCQIFYRLERFGLVKA